MQLDPNAITIKNRQRRTDLDISPEFIASVKKRVIHPIVLRQEDSEIILVVGERRLTALKMAEVNPLIEGNHFRFLSDLSPRDAKLAELEENVRRLDINWKDQVRAYNELNEIMLKDNPAWRRADTARELNISQARLSQFLMVFKNLEKPALRDASGVDQAYSILQLLAERRTVSVVEEITQLGKVAFQREETQNVSNNTFNFAVDNNANNNSSGYNNYASVPSTSCATRSDTSDVVGNNSPPILNIDFLAWIREYSGEKFQFIHCDFPYDVDYSSYAKSLTSSKSDYDHKGFWPLLDGLLNNLDKIASYSSHLMIWFGMEFYEQTKTRLEEAGLFVHAHPLIWHKTDNAGIIPGRDNIYPRRIYETAFLCSRGRRPLVRSKANIDGKPTPSNATHPSQKSIPMLRHFFSMLIDETTRVLDPTCGSGSAIIAAEEEGAKEAIGLEFNAAYAHIANASALSARRLRRISL